jgi:glycosyltransferase involved in cell wall biosynthesis
MKVLYYNWVDYLDDEQRGGGVSLYQRNLLAEIDRQNAANGAGEQIEATFLAAGISHDLIRRRPRWESIRHGPAKDRHRRYEIINSATLAPAHHSFGQQSQLEDDATLQVFHDFIAPTGPYDVVHFNNLEGLPAAALGLKSRWPETRVVLSLHNYYPFCAQVNLWQREAADCRNDQGTRACTTCLPEQFNPAHLRLAHALAYHLKCMRIRPGSRAFDAIFHLTTTWGARASRLLGRTVRRLKRQRSAPSARAHPSSPHHQIRRQTMVALINAHCDHVLCVSDAVRQVAVAFGLAPEILHTSYIGTEAAAEFPRTHPKPQLPRMDGTLKLAYLGYMRRDKAFYFLLNALEALPDAVKHRLHLTIAARDAGDGSGKRLHALGQDLASLSYHDGYSASDLDTLLGDVDLGLVPVLWRDNLPQVAIEMHARHIPLITSDLGGARELSGSPTLTFPAGDTAAFQARLTAALNGEINLKDYWHTARPPVTMAQHLAALREVYGGVS